LRGRHLTRERLKGNNEKCDNVLLEPNRRIDHPPR
jgi:hypothetical protein